MKNIFTKEFFAYASIPIFLIGMFALLNLVFRAFDLSSFQEVIEYARYYYEDYGFWLVFIGALVEGALFVNWYMPGSVVIVFGVVFARPDPLKAVIMVLLVVLGFLIGACLNYALGKYGLYRLFMKLGLEKPLDGVKKRVEKKGLGLIFSTYLHPNLGALTATSAGILNLPFTRFFIYSLAALIVWNSLWGTIAYIVGPPILNYLGTHFIYVVSIFWLCIITYQYFTNRNKPEPVSIP